MIEFILSLPFWVGCAFAMVFTAFSGLAVYIVSNKLIEKSKTVGPKMPINNLFRFVGIFVSLLLSLTFSEVITEWKAIKDSIDREAAALADTYGNLKYFDAEGTREIRTLLIEYAQAVIDDDWPAMAKDRLGQQTSTLKKQFTEKIIELRQVTPFQEKLWFDLKTDLDIMSDYRLIRLNHSMAEPPFYIIVIILGVFLCMVCLGVYEPNFVLVALVSLCMLFIGLVIYIILAMSDPFQGAIIIKPAPFEYLIEAFESGLR